MNKTIPYAPAHQQKQHTRVEEKTYGRNTHIDIRQTRNWQKGNTSKKKKKDIYILLASI
jgi:hypothetical protein